MESDSNNKKINTNTSEMSSCSKSNCNNYKSRWNPTKEQISMLEEVYKQGMKTPNADQIHDITSRLKAFGHVEGKNVFYWFQNYKAKLRQKKKRESLGYINTCLHQYNKSSRHHGMPPLFASPAPNVIPPGPYNLQQRDSGFYPPQSKNVRTSGNIKRSHKKGSKMEETIIHYDTSASTVQDQNQAIISDDKHKKNDSLADQEPLPLFPLNPTGILQESVEAINMSCSSSLVGATNDSVIESEAVLGGGDKSLFDFSSLIELSDYQFVKLNQI